MHPLFAKASSLTEGIIAGAIEVHQDKGPGLVEGIYEWCPTKELTLRQLRVENQRLASVSHKGFAGEEPLRFDLSSSPPCSSRPRRSNTSRPFTRRSS